MYQYFKNGPLSFTTPAPVNVNENNYQIEEVILLNITSSINLSHSYLCWIIILIWIYFSMESLTFFFSLSVCTLSHTLSACFSLSPSLYLYLYISASHSLSSSLSISLYLSSVLHCCPLTIQLIFYYLFILFCLLYYILPW